MSSLASPASDRRRLPRSIPLAIAAALLGAALIGIALVDVDLIDPRITVRWDEDISAPHREMGVQGVMNHSRETLEGRVNAAIFSATGARDLLLTGWIVGAPLVVVAASLWRQCSDEVRTALGYALSSVIFTIIIWPVQGLGEEMDLIFTRFPAVYALTWICAHDPTRTKIAAVLLASGHYVFWRVCLDPRFVNTALQ